MIRFWIVVLQLMMILQEHSCCNHELMPMSPFINAWLIHSSLAIDFASLRPALMRPKTNILQFL